jgi:transposase
MISVPVYVGLDYHQDTLQLCILDPQGAVRCNRACPNDADAVIRLIECSSTTAHVALECCTGAADLAEDIQQRRPAWSIDLAHPGYVARMRQNPDKTDYQDARLLADLERVGYLPRVWLAPESVRELRRLVRHRQDLAQQRRAVKLRLRALLRDQRLRPPADVRAWTRRWWAWLATAALSPQGQYLRQCYQRQLQRLAEDLAEVEERLRQVTAADPVVAQLRQQKGIGEVTAWTLRAEVGRFDRFRTGKQLARFCGLSPRNASSGQRQADAGLVKAANPALRAILIEAAHRLIQYEPRWRQFAQRLRATGKPGSVVAAAVANRWVRGLFHTMQLAA